MITETSHHERTFAEVKRLCSSGLEGPELLRRVAGRLQLTVPFEAYFAATIDPASNLSTNLLRELPDDEDLHGRDGFLDVFLNRVYFEEDLDRLTSTLRERPPVQLLSESTGVQLDRSLRYREVSRPRGLGYEMDSGFVDESVWGVLAMVRGSDDPDFSDREVEVVKRIAPHVGAGLKAATLRSRATDRETEDAPGVLTLDHAGRLLFHTPSAERWLGDLEDLRPHWRESTSLPIVVSMVVGALKRSLDPASDRDLNLVPKVRARGRSGRWLTLYGSLSESTPGRPSETVIVIEPTRPQEVAWLNVAAHGLSPREEEVIRLVVRSFSNRQISNGLFIAENTVQRHLSNIFEKVGVRSRKELLKRLFFENLLPGMLGT